MLFSKVLKQFCILVNWSTKVHLCNRYPLHVKMQPIWMIRNARIWLAALPKFKTILLAYSAIQVLIDCEYPAEVFFKLAEFVRLRFLIHMFMNYCPKLLVLIFFPVFSWVWVEKIHFEKIEDKKKFYKFKTEYKIYSSPLFYSLLIFFQKLSPLLSYYLSTLCSVGNSY